MGVFNANFSFENPVSDREKGYCCLSHCRNIVVNDVPADMIMEGTYFSITVSENLNRNYQFLIRLIRRVGSLCFRRGYDLLFGRNANLNAGFIEIRHHPWHLRFPNNPCTRFKKSRNALQSLLSRMNLNRTHKALQCNLSKQHFEMLTAFRMPTSWVTRWHTSLTSTKPVIRYPRFTDDSCYRETWILIQYSQGFYSF